jgi:hypothetical protein
MGKANAVPTWDGCNRFIFSLKGMADWFRWVEFSSWAYGFVEMT